MDADTSLRIGGRHAPVLCLCACVRSSWPGRAGRFSGRVLVRLTFYFGRFAFLLCSTPSRLRFPLSSSFVCPAPPPFSFFFRCCFLRAPFVSCFLWFLAPGALGLVLWPPLLGFLCALASFVLPAWPLAALWWLPPPPFCVWRFSLPPLGALCFFFFSLLVGAPGVSGFLLLPAPGALGLGAVLCVFFWPPASRLSVRSRLFVSPAWPLAAPPSPPFCVSWFLSLPQFFFPSLVCAPVVFGFLWFPAPAALGLGAVLCSVCSALCAPSPRLCVLPGRWLLRASCCPPPPFVARGFRCCCSVPCFFFLPVCAPVVSGFLWSRALGALGLGAVCCLFGRPPPSWLSVRSRLVSVSRLAVGCSLVVSAPPPPLCLAVFVAAARCSVLFFSPCVVRPRRLSLTVVSGPGCPGPRRCALFALLTRRFSALRALYPLSCFPPGRWVLPGGCCPPPPPFCVSRFSLLPLGAVCRVLCCAVCPWVRCCVALLRIVHPVLCCCVLCCLVALVWCCCLFCRALWRCPSPWGPVLCGAVFCGVPPRCVRCALCVLSWCVGARCCSPLCFVLCVSWGAALCVSCSPRSVRCCASLCWCACDVLFVWCVLLLAPGAVVRCCVLLCFFI